MNINMQNSKGIKLKTADTYCAEDINVTPVLEEIIVNPTNTKQIIVSSTNCVGIKRVTVNAVPTEEKTVTANGTVTPTSGKFLSKVTVNVSTSDGFNNLKELILTPSTYVNNTPAGDFYFEGNGTFKLKDSSPATGIESIKVQLPVVPGDGIIFDKTTDGNCEIKAADYKPTITLKTSTATRVTSHYGRIYYMFDVGNSNTATDIANGKYNVTIYDQTSGGGHYYCPLQGDTMTFLGEEVPNNNYGGKPSSVVGWTFKEKESETVVGFWRDSHSLNGGGGGATLYQHTLTYSSDHFASDEGFSNEVSGSFYISFYSTHGHFESASDFWTWLIGRGSIDTPGGHMWGSMGGDTAFDRIIVLGDTDQDKYIKFESFGGYGEWTAQQYLKNADATGLTDTIIDGFRDM